MSIRARISKWGLDCKKNINSIQMADKNAVFNLGQPCACSNHMTRLRPKKHANAEYLATIFNALRSLGYLGLLSSYFNNQAGINAQLLPL